MGSPLKSLTEIRQARRKQAPPPTKHFQTYKPEYEEILREMAALGGEPLVTDLRDWIVEHVHETGTLPKPAAVRKRARKICGSLDCRIPPTSPLKK